jgi:hypothetical protein
MSRADPIAVPLTAALACLVRAGGALRRRLARDDRGEGVSSAGIVVLIMALLGAAMWVTFKGVWEDVKADTEQKVGEIGDP